MFDSLNAIMERVESGTTQGDCESLLRLFYDPARARHLGATGHRWRKSDVLVMSISRNCGR